ncbi:hypothetical protein CCYS_01555 [Corynebacterium cystitidis DSM 20524]|uniref:Pentapeptide repeat-containing protein n=2 Tax=Corynebacterium cystitidis TaxID=35757 RepID=A0A1H9WIJ2_9CORY|nr:hypothetical protein CCYS_01555 [Corynebacterium cystitidis DSM 20524]SES33710.1 hypothetical protein SAMN05661109_02758 [Corynebacterium cystitidis DSM 20524]SNV88654.1 Uncharacterised protein [Corynebacterium cystitidis]
MGVKVQGVIDAEHYENHTFEGQDFDALRFQGCVFTQPRFVDCTGYHVDFRDCIIEQPVSVGTTWDKIRLFNSTLTYPAVLLRARDLNTISGSTLIDVHIVGSTLPTSSSLVITDSRITGSISNVVFVENTDHTQCVQVDLTECQLTNVCFVGIPAERLRLPKHLEGFICPDWQEVAATLQPYVRHVVESAPVKSPEYEAATRVRRALELDEYYGRNLSERGARFISELAFADDSPVSQAVKEIYAKSIDI